MAKIRLEGAQRACTPEETITRMQPHFKAAGITRISDITGLDRIGIPVSQCIRPEAIVLAVDSGKGATPAAARASAIMEGFERHVAEVAVVDTVAFESISNPELRFPLLKGAFLNTAPRPLACVAGIASEKEVFVPAELIALKPNQPAFPLFHSCYSGSSNGLSSGNNYWESVAGGLYEVIERDQVAHSMADKSRKRVNLFSAKGTLATLVEKIRIKDVFPVLFDCTKDLGVPTYTAFLFDSECQIGASKGYASHLNPEVAQCRAICEAIQSRLVFLAGSRDDISSEKFSKLDVSNSMNLMTSFMAEKDVVPCDLHGDKSQHTFQDDVEIIINLLCSKGIPEPLVYEFKHEYPCSVVRVLAPTLAGYYSEFTQFTKRS